MANRIGEFIESIVYAGMKPAGRSSEDAPAAKPGWLSRLLNGPAQSDPLYLTNRTAGQKARRALLLVSPIVLVTTCGILAIFLFAPPVLFFLTVPVAGHSLMIMMQAGCS